MTIKDIIFLAILGVGIIAGIVAIIVAIVRGDLKKFIVEKMEEANQLYGNLPKPDRSIKKLQYVLEAVKEKYKIADLFLNVKKFIEYIVQINNKNM